MLHLVRSQWFLIIPTIVVTASVELMAAKDNLFCEQVIELLQKNIGSGSRLNLDAEPFSKVTWEPAVLVRLRE